MDIKKFNDNLKRKKLLMNIKINLIFWNNMLLLNYVKVRFILIFFPFVKSL